jgi:uncharacterized protein YegP (UPF0339 family)
MQNEEKKDITISKKNTGFPAYLDFDKLRSEGISYLGKLSGHLWTDHNVHDPGITIFEELCYAVLDLGYRANLPIQDILARDPADNSKDDNFFTPAQILTCNPLTVNDYRKLLIDIKGVKNAWLQPATDVKNFCNKPVVIGEQDPLQPVPNQPALPVSVIATAPSIQTPGCEEFLNGLYHVYIETEKELKENSDEWNALLLLIKQTLLAHRNLCEDFADIYILCKKEVGVCASIELEETANAENVYVAIATRLREFFSPSPVFYTLPQLLEKGKAIEDIFAGRPYSKESHGFVDTEELEKIKLRKEIHISDIYNTIFEVAGVKKISKLWLKNCGEEDESLPKNKNSRWKYSIPENHIPSFTIACSGFEFTKNGMPVAVDTEKFDTLLELNFIQTGKVAYTLPSTNLDNEIPKGIYRSGLDDYYSIQNDFPQVYGIAEGALPNDTVDKRKAWALQLKGYLLFFDQMLANYLAQLKNIRQLFSLGGSVSKKKQHTYFLHTLKTVPEMSRLLRFGTGDGSNGLGVNGSVLVYPVVKEHWEQVNTELLMAETILSSQKAYTFNSLYALDEATSLLRDDLMNEGETIIKTYRTRDESYLFTITSSAAEFILLGKKVFPTEAAAMQQAASVQYTGVFEDNYRSFLTATNHFTFNIELNIVSYTDYLGMLVEDDALCIQRRKQFLSHLLSRFAEKFTDFALLNWKAGQENKGIDEVERFLTQYDDLSRNRGRAYNYLSNGWNNNNVSGFEKKVKALAGIDDWNKNNLCHFTVDPFDEQYVLDLSTLGKAAFVVNEKFDLLADATQTVAALIKAMADPANYKYNDFDPETKQYRILMKYGNGRTAMHPERFSNSGQAEKLVQYIAKSFSQQPDEKALTEFSWIWKVELRNSADVVIKTSNDIWRSEKDALAAIDVSAKKINESQKWTVTQKQLLPGELYPHKANEGVIKFTDIAAFNIDINDTVIGKPGKFTYDVLDKDANSFKLCPTIVFDNEKQARAHCCEILTVAANENNFLIKPLKNSTQYKIELKINGEIEAESAIEYETKLDAKNAVTHIANTVSGQCYTLHLNKTPESWKFRYQLGPDEKNCFWFDSEVAYQSREAAAKAAALFHKNIEGLTLKEAPKKIILADTKSKEIPVVAYASLEGEAGLPVLDIKKELEEQQKIALAANIIKPQELKAFVKVEEAGVFDTFVYRLVNKDRVPAVFTQSFNLKNAKEARKTVAAESKKMLGKIPGLCLGGNIFTEVRDKENNKFFRYQLKFYNVENVPGNELILFESVKGYISEEEAGAAFLENYLQVLRLASNKEEYGKNISIKPVELPAKDDCGSNEALVYIPADTLTLLNSLHGINWIEKLVGLIKTYPIKIIDASSKEFAALFCVEYKEELENCSASKKKWVYYFSMPVSGEAGLKMGYNEWRSTRFYETADAAMQDFRYFCRLLKYTGNYYVDCGCTKTLKAQKDWKNSRITEFDTIYEYKLFIREVLAQSVNYYQRPEEYYQRPEEAWGKQGIEKFICAVQSGNAFKNYQRKADGCYSFYVTCGQGLLEHPCTYDTEKQRDKALDALYEAFIGYDKNNLFRTAEKEGALFLNNTQNTSFAAVAAPANIQWDNCDIYIDISEEILSGFRNINYIGGSLFYNIQEKGITVQSIDNRIIDNKQEQEKWIQEWRAALQNWACYFPISRTKLNAREKQVAGAAGAIVYKYCIEIKLPGFNSCADDTNINKPCTCNENESVAEPTCYIAWKGICCYKTCAAAMDALRKAIDQLRGKTNYRPTFDCECNSFGINLHTHNPVLVTPQINNTINSDIIAINPQCYSTPDEVCEAADTAKKLVNSEGLHLVEHILLRPHCQQDCECRKKTLPICNTECHFPSYPSNDEDPCTDYPANICFKPGIDPYSFIATAVLPAWGQRFREESNRLMLETLIYREAPAHILLRILWLKPKDFCEYESVFKRWGKWVGGLKTCPDDFNPCTMLEMVFARRYDCLDECTECQPCKEPVIKKQLTCEEDQKKRQTEAGAVKETADRFPFLNQVNDVYCLAPYCKKDDRADFPSIAVTEKKLTEAKAEKIATSKIVERKQPGLPLKKEVKTISKKPEEIIKQPVDTANKEKEAVKKSVQEPAKPLLKTGMQLKAQVINARLAKYRNITEEVLEHSKGNPIATRLQRYMASGDPDVEILDKLAEEIIRNEKPVSKAMKHFNSKQQLRLLQAAVCYYLDKICFNGKDETRINALQKVTARLVKAGIDMQSVYNYWDAAEVEKYEPTTDTDFIRHIIMESK